MQGIAELGAGKLYPKVPPYWALTAPLLGRAEEVEGLESKTLLWAQWNDFFCYLQAGASAREGKKKKKKRLQKHPGSFFHFSLSKTRSCEKYSKSPVVKSMFMVQKTSNFWLAVEPVYVCTGLLSLIIVSHGFPPEKKG